MAAPSPFVYNDYFHPRLIKWLARWNLTDVEIAVELGVPLTTLEDWKIQHPEVSAAIKEGRAYWIDLAENSLQKLMKGYSYDETQIELDTQSGDPAQAAARPKKIVKITRQVPPNASVILFMLQNHPLFQLLKRAAKEMPLPAIAFPRTPYFPKRD